jgi:hypothetical protein
MNDAVAVETMIGRWTMPQWKDESPMQPPRKPGPVLAGNFRKPCKRYFNIQSVIPHFPCSSHIWQDWWTDPLARHVSAWLNCCCIFCQLRRASKAYCMGKFQSHVKHNTHETASIAGVSNRNGVWGPFLKTR